MRTNAGLATASARTRPTLRGETLGGLSGRFRTAEAIGIRGLLVHALASDVVALYRRLGLDPSPLDPMTLMVTLVDLRASLT